MARGGRVIIKCARGASYQADILGIITEDWLTDRKTTSTGKEKGIKKDRLREGTWQTVASHYCIKERRMEKGSTDELPNRETEKAKRDAACRRSRGNRKTAIFLKDRGV